MTRAQQLDQTYLATMLLFSYEATPNKQFALKILCFSVWIRRDILANHDDTSCFVAFLAFMNALN